jgi:hypothetical protein
MRGMPPSIIDQIREQQAWEAPKRSSKAGLVVGVLAAFGIGILLVVGWGALPQLSIRGLTAGGTQKFIAVPAEGSSAPASTAAPAKEVSIPTGGRIGIASESNLLKTCLPNTGIPGMGKKDIYNLLQTTSQMMTMGAIMGQDAAVGAKGYSMMWASVTDCVFRQNGYMLCDPDNRALAVEAISTFIRQTQMAAAPEKDSDFVKVMATVQGPRRQALEHAMYRVRATRERVLDTLKVRAQEGRFIAADFGFFTPGEVMAAVRAGKPTADACANKT